MWMCRADLALENGIEAPEAVNGIASATAPAAAAATGEGVAEAGEQAPGPAQNGPMPMDEEQTEDEVAAKFKPGIKFKIAT
jgi:hypothetical protein